MHEARPRMTSGSDGVNMIEVTVWQADFRSSPTRPSLVLILLELARQTERHNWVRGCKE